jgi:transposase InsO family protein
VQTEVALVMPHLLKSRKGGAENEPSGGLVRKDDPKERARRTMRRSSERFFDRVKRFLEIRSRRVRGHKFRGFDRQREVREAQRQVKLDVLAFVRWRIGHGESLGAAAHQLKLPERTIQQWWTRWRSDRLRPVSRGRAPDPLEVELKEEIQGFIEMVGPDIGVATLKAQFPAAPRGALAHLLALHRFELLGKGAKVIQRLHWNQPGTTWAMDYMFPPRPVEGWFRAILVVRDLATKLILAAMPVRNADQNATVDLLTAMFAEHGAPFVIKSDNGSHFTGQEATEFFERHRVLHLRSPPRYPQFNGSVEAGIGAMRTWAHHRAASAGRADNWTLDDVLAAVLTVNHLGRPHGDGSPTPVELWRERHGSTTLEREEVMQSYYMERFRAEREEAASAGAGSGADPLRVTRVAIVRSLISLGLIVYSRSRITPGYKFRKYAGIS